MPSNLDFQKHMIRNAFPKFSQILGSAAACRLVLVSLAVSAVLPVYAQDHPLISGMPGFRIASRAVVEYGTYGDETFKCEKDKLCTSTTPGFDDAGRIAVEGKVTKLKYQSQQAAGELAIRRNYDNALKSLGGKKLNNGDKLKHGSVFLVENRNQKVWVVLGDVFDDYYELTFIEQRQFEQKITTGGLGESLAKQGYVTLRVNFENNKAELLPTSKPALTEVVSLLKADSALKLSIDGHTDDVGQAAANKQLSQARAQSVVNALVAEGVNANRLKAQGFGAEKPIADNRTEEGRARNRRVELVKQP